MNTQITENNLTPLEGLTFEQAKTELINVLPNFSIRIVKENGRHYMVTCDMNLRRVNVEIEKGIISKVDGIG